MKQQTPETDQTLLIVVLMALGIVMGFFLLRIQPILFMILAMAAILVGLGRIWYLNRVKKKRQQQYEQTSEGQIDMQINFCQAQIERQQQERIDIQKNIEDLARDIRSTPHMHPDSKSQSEKLMIAFQKEIDLRTTKIEFYETCLEKLKLIKDNHRVLRTLEEKKEQLRKLQETHYDDLADMERVRSDLSYEKGYLDSIQDLAGRMLSSNSLETAQGLQLELVELTKEIRRE